MKYTSHKKIIPYQTVINLQKELETYHSFDNYFQELFDCLDGHKKQKNSTDIPVNHLILKDFYHKYQQLGVKMNKELRIMKQAETIKPQPLIN